MLVFHHDALDSTSSEAQRLAASHPGQTLLVSATRQSAGRGSHGRDWSSPEGGAWFTLAVPMTEPQAATPLVVGDAIQQVLLTEAPGVTIKPPNDLLLNGKKIVGILCEQTLTAGRANQPTVFIGVGINVNLDPAALPADLRMPATSLRETLGRELDIPHLTRRCAAAILARLGRPCATHPDPPSEANAYLADHIALLASSLRHVANRELLSASNDDPVAFARAVWEAPQAILSHGNEPDPILNYANQAALERFDLSWDDLITMPSRLTAEAPNREERARLLQLVTDQGYIPDYTGTRISRTGERFQIQNALVWNLTDAAGERTGQAAMFSV